MNLQATLITIWFRMTEALIKKEDYRGITPYWCNRLLLWYGEKKSKQFWENEVFTIVNQTPAEYLLFLIEMGAVTFKPFTTNTMTLGYPNKTDTARILKFKHEGIEIRTGNQDWGAEPDKLYFVIKHGERII